MNNDLLITIDKRMTVQSSKILMLKADINYTHILLDDGSTIISSRTLGIFEKRLYSYSFFRPNRSVIINLKYIASFQKESFTIRMENDELISISRRRTKQFLKRI
ncbi:LytTR family DNA-binding domain-containing protein [Emticicia sp. BO119]|uniref:LytR/AlgR family response regulator transcription factor n=1 Tax=Emticicia sp. BO119 TaxID=2757768 RepID=UPI0015F04019|nr:LytTR family DNA-binding domain-containing protein [Emticicia sp. BO119]MBA4853835.1 LytTR family transcriptional regulator [Emticicia sp. BO119]